MTEQVADTNTAAATTNQAATGSEAVHPDASVETNVSAQELSIQQAEDTNQIPNRAEAAAEADRVETEEKGIFSEGLADQVADQATGDADASISDATAEGEAVAADYTEFTLPEGVNLNEGAMKDFVPMAKEAKLTQEQAQKFVDMGGRIIEESVALQEQAHQEQKQEWINASFNHPELGAGRREQYKEAMGYADKAMRAFGDKDLAKTLMDTGLVHNPSLLIYFKKAGQAISEDSLVLPGRGRGSTEANIYKGMYPASDHPDAR